MIVIGEEFTLKLGEETSCLTEWGELKLTLHSMIGDIGRLTGSIQNRDAEIGHSTQELQPRCGASVLLGSFFTRKQGWPRLQFLSDKNDEHKFILFPPKK